MRSRETRRGGEEGPRGIGRVKSGQRRRKAVGRKWRWEGGLVVAGGGEA